MYEEKASKSKNTNFLPKQRKINLPKFTFNKNTKQLLIKIFTLLTIIILIIFIISRINLSAKTKKENVNQSLNIILESSLKYFNSNNIPQNEGDSIYILLTEMIKKKIIPNIKNKNDNNHFTNSYIILNKKKEELYTLKIYLTNSKNIFEKNLECANTCQIKEK